MSKYQFTLDKLTIGDLLAISRAAELNDFHAFTQIADRYTVGGVLHLPYREYQDVINAFAQAFSAQVYETGGATPPEVSRILRQALGDENTNA
jgi:hypothetical protein